MISAACVELGERALVCAGAMDFSRRPRFDLPASGRHHELRSSFSSLPPSCTTRGAGHHRGLARRRTHVDPLSTDLDRTLGSADQHS